MHLSSMAAAHEGPILFFDGVCGLCNGFVDFLMARDKRGAFRFAALQGETAAAALAPEDLPGEASPPQGGGDGAEALRSVILRDGEGLHRRSEAAIRCLAGLGGYWSLANLLRLVPRPLRDLGYDFIARHRYRWFGKRETCRMPTPAERGRFLP